MPEISSKSNSIKIVSAKRDDLSLVYEITQKTIDAVYPHYYPAGAVDFFKKHHCEENILSDIENGIVYLLTDEEKCVGTVTVKGNEICRLFVLPEFQGKGYGRVLLDFSEEKVFENEDRIVLDASFSAKAIYTKRGFTDTGYHTIRTENGDCLCYDAMEKRK